MYKTHLVELSSQFHVGILFDDEGGEAGAQHLHDVLQEHGLRVERCLLGREEGALHHRAVVEHLLEVLVLPDDALVIFILEPVTMPLFQFLHELGIEHVVVDEACVVDAVGIDADETARAGGVNEGAQVIALGYTYEMAVNEAKRCRRSIALP